ncbi:MAG TPA: redoxin domain-containing protein [Saprospiraceae bacterium]|nr:redoxin domain-containing protein [Saprospiraceae bacterium]
MIVQKGTRAPDFILYSSEKKQVHLADLQGTNVLILFFPLAFTSTCTKELCMMRDDLERYNDCNATILAISVDSPQTLAKYKEDQGLNFTLLSDFNKEVSRAYGAQYEEFSVGLRGVAKRAAFVIDKSGIVQYAEVLENANNLPNFEVINTTLAELN